MLLRDRRTFLAGSAATLTASSALAESHDHGLYERVYGQNEAYDPAADRWEAYAPMPTPRHGLGAAVIGDFIHVAGGGAVMGGRIQSAAHKAFTLG